MLSMSNLVMVLVIVLLIFGQGKILDVAAALAREFEILKMRSKKMTFRLKRCINWLNCHDSLKNAE